ncbi:TSUP family transporter [Serratia ficaria]|uniref:TSUP family transporter n=2 Tax=Serratia TaxID=613 RepID=UPI00217B25FC|nr:TSUP family transporter [Serratia ficaria]CAI0812820.1 Sulfite exporter TauE/SafE [Serratia ficaria]CAI0859403.1 Sulfite exporter TauE/SafE [Serratia ficaria]CAI1542549.1 Sulfite exporter TauE/SafE [Serratia ficaria]CAI1585599.1 Sulfite exporter TauE/SafE [Serratia ficaria]CAI2138167.1 Sulfite exporter TauE/SafE [Serratia ficaria]
MEHQYLFYLVIALFAVIQSVFGMGILVFGTPTLLMLGFDFSSVLGLLLPSSVLISLTQAIGARQLAFPGREKINMLICAFFVVLALSLVLHLELKINIDLLVGAILLFSALMRFRPALQNRVQSYLSRHQRSYIVIMGLVHGVTNMGGALLALYASAGHREKLAIRTTVSGYYLMFGVIQLTTLAIFKWQALSFSGFAAAPLALLVYLAVGNLLFKKASAPVYEKMVTYFITFYGVVVLTKGYL